MFSSLWCGEGTGGSRLGRVHVDNACVVVTGGQQANTSSSYSIWSQVPRRDPSLAAPGLNHIASPCSSVADPRQVDADLYPIPVFHLMRCGTGSAKKIHECASAAHCAQCSPMIDWLLCASDSVLLLSTSDKQIIVCRCLNVDRLLFAGVRVLLLLTYDWQIVQGYTLTDI